MNSIGSGTNINRNLSSISKLYNMASYMYILPPYRFTVYAIGIALGYLLRTQKGSTLTRNKLTLGWFVAVGGLVALAFIVSMMSVYNYKFNVIHAAFFSALSPIPFCFFFAWIIYSAQMGHKSINAKNLNC